MTTAFPPEIINGLVSIIKEKKWDQDLHSLYKWELKGQLDTLQGVCKEMPPETTKWLGDVLAIHGEPSFKLTLELRKQMPVMLRTGNADELEEVDQIKEIKLWIVRNWGGIQRGDNGSLLDCIKIAVAQEKKSFKPSGRNKSGKKEFDFERIPSWSKYLAFKQPQQYAIYDARVIYSLNWLLHTINVNRKKEGTEVLPFKFFPFLDGQNSVMGLLDYSLHLLLFRHGKHKLLQELEKDIENRAKPSSKSSLKRNLEDGLFIRKQEAFSEYCDLLSELADAIYPEQLDGEFTDTHRLTKIEMMLFSIADKQIAENVMDSLTG
jgi:hypothetical protein